MVELLLSRIFFEREEFSVNLDILLLPGDIEQHLYTLRGIGFPVSKLANEGYVIFHNRFQYGRI